MQIYRELMNDRKIIQVPKIQIVLQMISCKFHNLVWLHKFTIVKRKMCHKCVTICQIKNRIPKVLYTGIKELHNKFDRKISKGVVRRVKSRNNNTNKNNNKGNHFNTGPTTSCWHSNKNKDNVLENQEIIKQGQCRIN